MNSDIWVFDKIPISDIHYKICETSLSAFHLSVRIYAQFNNTIPENLETPFRMGHVMLPWLLFDMNGETQILCDQMITSLKDERCKVAEKSDGGK